ncbi:MAG: dTDP-4-amino-4,6-dideoxygalactose transaminase [Lachnospiraceae bacterium]|nr:dTDP-4-amino-4,6-dideoxygalactose transaminase [Lachnospiraceae bacterium]
MIPFNIPPRGPDAEKYISEAIASNTICGDGAFTRKCSDWMKERFGATSVLLTTSGSTALDMSMMLCGLKEGDEVILPSYTFSSTANSVILTGATPVFVDIRPDTMNIDETKIEDAVTPRTKAVCVVHYAGVACEMDAIGEIASRHGLKIVEDAAQGVMSTYKGKALGTLGDFGCYSFHETKNYSMGEGGALLMRDETDVERAEIIREKGTNRSRYKRGQVDKYTWESFGGSYLPSELNAAYLWTQLEIADEINEDRLRIWRVYDEALKPLAERGLIEQPVIPSDCVHNAHMYYIKVKDLETRTRLFAEMKEEGVLTASHYIPLHSAPAGVRYGRFHGEDVYTTRESERLLRLPLYYGLTAADQEYVVRLLEKLL